MVWDVIIVAFDKVDDFNQSQLNQLFSNIV